jgi:hypothetical protein
MISILGHVKMPVPESESNISKENFDSYFSKLQTICTDNMNEDVKPVCDSAKSALQTNFAPTTSSSAI